MLRKDLRRLCVIFLVDNVQSSGIPKDLQVVKHGTVAEEGGELELFPNPTGYDYNEAWRSMT